MLESLETRVLCASGQDGPSVAVRRGTLVVTGTAGDDSIVVSSRRDRVRLTLNGKTRAFDETIRRFVIDGGAGDDYLSSTAFLPATMNGGPGDDLLEAGSDRDTLLGGSGDDRLNGIEGLADSVTGNRIYLDAGPGNDRLTFGNVLYGGSGHDIAQTDGPGEFNFVPVTGGIERFRNDDVPRATLATRNGRLRLTYPVSRGEPNAVGTPFVRDDGVVQVNVTLDYGNPANPPDGSVLSVAFNARYTALAASRGLLLAYTSPDTPSRAGYEYTLLIPQR